ncbi:hypothetical protein Salmuc_05005 [Salipiger mucosus DSM 16094]|uniref:Uncharacterized protein n=1 Tax=Salipiger mucosus DSM 16094 TaxID=1123237 RepID=S9R1A8_9RHOB|nr:hypothetical protein Salmuc_05005 [Salipiger mucosus DSM 16094]
MRHGSPCALAEMHLPPAARRRPFKDRAGRIAMERLHSVRRGPRTSPCGGGRPPRAIRTVGGGAEGPGFRASRPGVSCPKASLMRPPPRRRPA